jgi:hypothetical protein
MDVEARKRIVERHLRNVRWEGEVGFAECPGVLEHTHPNQPRDCKIFVSGRTVTVCCFHESCAELIQSVNRLIRSELAGLPGELTRGERKEYSQKVEVVSQVAQRILEQKEKIYLDFWLGEELLAKSLGLSESRAYFFTLFKDSDILWIGDVRHSGINSFGHFRTVANWKKSRQFWEYTCTGIFGSETNLYRRKSQVIRQDYYVLEFDKLDLDPKQNQLKSVALYSYLKEISGLRGRVAILSGNKSIHFWIHNDPKIFDSSFQLFLKELGADPAGFRPYQPVRFPGVIRSDTNKPQSLIVL